MASKLAESLAHSFFAVAGSTTLLAMQAFAAAPVPSIDAGALDVQKNQLEKFNRPAPVPEREDRPVIRTPETASTQPVNTAQGPRFVLKKVVFSSSRFLTPTELDALVQPWLNREISMSDLDAILKAVNDRYAQQQLITAMAVLPPQKIQSGEVHIDLVEGRLGTAHIASTYTDPEFLLAHINLRKDEVIDILQVERDLSAFNRTHEIQLDSAIKPGALQGLTDFDIQATEPRRWVTRLFADNQNAPSLGREELGVDVRFNGLLGRGDVMDLMASGSSGATNSNLSYSVPFNHSGGQITASYSGNNIAIVDGPYSAIAIQGVSSRSTVGVSQPWLANREWLCSTTFSYSSSESTNTSNGMALSQFSINAYNLSLSIDRQAPEYQWSVQLGIESGTAVDQLQNSSSYKSSTLSGSTMQLLGKDYFANLRVGSQFSNATTLPPAALFQIGGPASVRGYDTGFATGFNGYFANIELHYSDMGAYSPFVFVDHGEVTSPTAAATYITGYGVGLSWTLDKLQVKASYAQPDTLIRPNQVSGRVDFRVELSF